MTLSQKFFFTPSPVEGQSLQQKKRGKGEKGNARKKFQKAKSLKRCSSLSRPKKSQNFDFCACLSHNALKRDAGGKKGKLLCCKCIFDWIKGNLAKIQPKNLQNVQKKHFLQKVPGVNGLIT